MKPIDLIKQMSDEHLVALLSGETLEYLIGPKWQRFDILMDPMKVQEIRIVNEEDDSEDTNTPPTTTPKTNTPSTKPMKKGLMGLFK